MKKHSAFTNPLLYFLILNFFHAILTQTPLQNRKVFQILDKPQSFLTSQDIIHFQTNSYIGEPWNLQISDCNTKSFIKNFKLLSD